MLLMWYAAGSTDVRINIRTCDSKHQDHFGHWTNNWLLSLCVCVHLATACTSDPTFSWHCVSTFSVWLPSSLLDSDQYTYTKVCYCCHLCQGGCFSAYVFLSFAWSLEKLQMNHSCIIGEETVRWSGSPVANWCMCILMWNSVVYATTDFTFRLPVSLYCCHRFGGSLHYVSIYFYYYYYYIICISVL